MIRHYTVGDSFNEILRDNLIRPATAYIPKHEKPIVWFSTEEFWEPTVSKGLLLADGTIKDLNMTDMLAKNMSLFRIGVDPDTAPLRWSDIKEQSGMLGETARNLAARAKKVGGNPSRWRGTFEPVSIEQWRAIDRLNN